MKVFFREGEQGKDVYSYPLSSSVFYWKSWSTLIMSAKGNKRGDWERRNKTVRLTDNMIVPKNLQKPRV